MARSAGAQAQLVSRESEYALLKHFVQGRFQSVVKLAKESQRRRILEPAPAPNFRKPGNANKPQRQLTHVLDPAAFTQPPGPVTLQYPAQQVPIPDTGRYRLYMETEDCIGCDQCARICPVDCITIEKVRAVDELGLTSDGSRWVTGNHGPRLIFPVAALAKVFRGKILEAIEQLDIVDRQAANIDDDGDFSNGLTPDAGVDVNDLLAFLGAFEAGDLGADLDDDGMDPPMQNGGVDVNDLIFFLAKFEGGC